MIFECQLFNQLTKKTNRNETKALKSLLTVHRIKVSFATAIFYYDLYQKFDMCAFVQTSVKLSMLPIDCDVNELLISRFKRFSKYAENMTQLNRLELMNRRFFSHKN